MVSVKMYNIIFNYLTSRTQRIKIGSTFSHWTNIVKGIMQGSILSLLLFKNF